jgi:hypothetical protein
VKDSREGRPPFVFPRWTNQLRAIGVLGTVAVLIYLIVFVAWIFGPQASAVGYAPDQPVPYSHKLHAGELGIDCRYCHNTVENMARAAIPPASTCMNCHAMIRTTSEKLASVRASFENGAHLGWARVHDLPDFVYFDHSAHLNAGVGCTSCHGRVDRMDVVHQEKPLTMGWCLDCHRNPRPHLRPRSAITRMDWGPQQAFAIAQRDLVREYDLTPTTNCSTCHR